MMAATAHTILQRMMESHDALLLRVIVSRWVRGRLVDDIAIGDVLLPLKVLYHFVNRVARAAARCSYIDTPLHMCIHRAIEIPD